jgi:hypothetical protein
LGETDQQDLFAKAIDQAEAELERLTRAQAEARAKVAALTMPVSWKGTLIQYAGRLHRLHSAKREVRIYDYVDVQVPVLSRMFAKRLRGYRSLGYAQGEAPAGFGEIDDDFILGRDWAEIDGEDDGTE